jgi:hypothetical protein
VWLLTHIARGTCGGPIGIHRPPRPEGDSRYKLAYYVCKRDRCASIRVDVADEYVQDVVVEWLSRPEVYKALRAATSHNDAQAATAHAEANKLRTELEEWRQDDRSASRRRDGTQRLTVSAARRAPCRPTAHLTACDRAVSTPAFPRSVQKQQTGLAPPSCRTPPGQ